MLERKKGGKKSKIGSGLIVALNTYVYTYILASGKKSKIGSGLIVALKEYNTGILCSTQTTLLIITYHTYSYLNYVQVVHKKNYT